MWTAIGLGAMGLSWMCGIGSKRLGGHDGEWWQAAFAGLLYILYMLLLLGGACICLAANLSSPLL